MKKFCGGPQQLLHNCSDILTEKTCSSKSNFWTVADGKTRYCEWNPSQNKCVFGDPCVCPRAPFMLDRFGTEHKSPTSCSDLTQDQCQYFETRDNRRCLLSHLGKCVDPPETDPQCTDYNTEDGFAAYSDTCPLGTTDSCSEICKDQNKSFTGPAREILSYECEAVGIGTGRYSRYCMCSK